MTTTTPYLGLVLYDATTDQAATFATFRANWGGTAPTSNFYKIDTAVSTIAGQITALQATRGAIRVPATFQSANFYSITGITNITAYTTGMTILLSLDTTSSGTVTLDINALGTKSVMKVDSTGTAINLTGSDLVKNRQYLFMYDGTRWTWVSANSADQIQIVGTAANVVTVGSTNNLEGTVTQSVLISATTNSATSKSTPVDADMIPIVDSAASNVLKKLTWANLKATLKAYFDPYYPPLPNVLINGNIDFWQRGTSFAAMATNTKIVDRFKWQQVSAAVYTASRNTDVPTIAQSGTKSAYSILLDCTTVDASIAAGDFAGFRTVVEGHDYAPLKDQTVTLTFWVKAVKTGIYCVSFRNSVDDRSYVVEYTISAASTWEKKTITLILNQTGGTEDYGNGVGLSIFWTILSGSTFQTTANAWQTGNFLATSSQVNGADNTANDFYITQIKLEKSSVATPFVVPLYADEYRRCLRYFWKSFAYDVAPAQNAGSNDGFRITAITAGATTQRWTAILNPVIMRADPVTTIYNPNAANAQARDVTGSLDCSGTGGFSTALVIFITCTGNASTVVGNSLFVNISVDAEY